MSFTDGTIHAAQDLIHVLTDPEPDSLLATLGNSRKEALTSLAEIFEKSNPPAVPPRFPVWGAYQEKFQKVN